MSREQVGEYISRVMKQKGLKTVDVERRSGGKIDRSHVSKIMRGLETNPSANAMMALAAGLGVNGHEVFTAVTGCALEEGESPVPALEFLALMESVAIDAELVNAVRGLVGLSPEGRVALMEVLRLHAKVRQAGRAKKSGSKKRR